MCLIEFCKHKQTQCYYRLENPYGETLSNHRVIVEASQMKMTVRSEAIVITRSVRGPTLDVRICRRQIFTSTVDPRTERVKYL